MNKKRNAFVCLLLVAILFLSATGCASNSLSSGSNEGNPPSAPSVSQGNEPNTPSESKSYADTIIVGITSDIAGLDPANSNAIPAIVYNTLLRISPETNEIEPCLAESFEQIDNVTYAFKLREGVRFHNGDELTTEDIKYNFDRCINNKRVGKYYSTYNSVEIVDKYNFIIHLKEPDAICLNVLCRAAAGIVSHKSEDSGEFESIGTGPYMVTDWVTGDHITFERFDDYFEGMPKTKTIIYRIIPENSARLIALETGEIQAAEAIAANDISKITSNSALKIFQKESSSYDYLCFNTDRAPFNDVRVRQALDYATDRGELVLGVYDGYALEGNSIIAPGVAFRNNELKIHSFDQAKAKELLATAGYPDGFDCKITVRSSNTRKTAEIIQSQWLEIGVNVEIDYKESAAFTEATNAGDFDIFIRDKNNNTGDPTSDLLFLHSKNVGNAGNRGRYANARFDELLDASQAELDQAKRSEMFMEMQDIIAEDSPWLILYYPTINVGAVANLEGFAFTIEDNLRWDRTYIPQ